MSSQIPQLYNKYGEYNAPYITHTSLIEPKGKYNFSRENSILFFKEYCELLQSNPDLIIGLTEIPNGNIPIIVDIDLNVPEDELNGRKSLYEEENVLSIIEIYMDILKYVIIDLKPEHLMCALLEKEPYTVEKQGKRIVKNGFHLHFPNLIVDQNEYKNIIFPKVLKRIMEVRMFDDLREDTSLVKYDQILDAACCTNPWLIYGARKSREMNAYKISKLYDSELSEINIDYLKKCVLRDAQGKRITYSKDISYYLPLIFSIHTYNRKALQVKPDITLQLQTSKPTMNIELNENRTSVKIKEDMEKAAELIPMIKEWRADSYGEWMQIGWILYNLCVGEQEGLELWLEFSRRSSRFEEGACEKAWCRMEDRNMSIGSLIFYAKNDSPAEFEEWKKSRVFNIAFEVTKYESHHDVARILKELYGSVYVCASMRYKTWFEFVNNRWKQIEEGHSLRAKITDDVVKVLRDYEKDLIKKFEENNTQGGEQTNEGDLLKKARDKIGKIITNLKNAGFKDNVMKEARELFYDETFLKNLNANPYLICFKNGIYDLEKNILREGCPDDYVSLRMPINYREFKRDDKAVLDVEDFLSKIFPDRSIREYFLNIYSDIFVGGNTHKHVMFWSGEGDNGKSVTEVLFEKMLGEYAIKLPTSLITGKRTASSSACPELVRAGNGVRWAVLQEPDKKDVLNIGILKELSGNDTFFARGLFEAGGEITPMFKLILVCNDPPKVPYSDKATWRRIRVCPFESTFADEAPEDEAEQFRQKIFPKDKHFMDKIPSMTEALAWLLLDHRKRMGNNKSFSEPEKVREATNQYRNKNDAYTQFATEHIVEDKESFGNGDIPTKIEDKECYIRLWGEPTIKGIKWEHKKLHYDSEDDEETGSVV